MQKLLIYDNFIRLNKINKIIKIKKIFIILELNIKRIKIL